MKNHPGSQGGQALSLAAPDTACAEPRQGRGRTDVMADGSRSERYFRALIERSSELVCVLDRQGRLLYANGASLELLGYRPDEALGRSAFEFVAPEELVRLRALFRKLTVEPGAVVTAEYEACHRDGSRRIVRGTARNLLHDPAVGGVVLNVHDITERRRAEDALRESEARFAHIAATIPGMVYQYAFRTDGTAGYTFVSEGARAMFGVAPREALEDREALLGLIDPRDRPEFGRRAAAAAGKLDPFQWEGRVVLRSGEERFVRVVAQDERQPDGTVLSDGIVMDVTALRRATRQLEASEQRYRSLIEHNPDAVFSFDLEGRFVSANPACEVLSGYAPAELLGQTFDPLVSDEDLELARSHFATAAAGTATRYEITLRHRSGRSVRIGVTNVPIVIGGRIVGVFGIAKDRTRQRELEAQLRQAQKMEAVGRLAGGVAHDFNNLLTVIKTYTQMALAELPPEADAGIGADLREVQAAATRAATLTRQLLAFSRQQVLHPRRLDVNRTVGEVATMLGRLIGEDITLQTELAPAVWPVYADPGQLEQVLMNLAVNARDAMSRGGVLRLRTGNVAVDDAGARERPGLVAGEYAALIVEDTGTGIHPSVLPQIFEPFFTTKGPGQGTGLGLATVYGIVKQSGGFVYADSTVGEGSRFTVLLPRTDAAADDDGQPVSLRIPGGTETVLLVEDDPAVRGAVHRMLSKLGYTVLEASSAVEAIRVAEQAQERGVPIALVLTDVVMPGESGRVLGEQIAARWPALVVLFMSGYPGDEIVRRGLARSGAALLEKPFTAERLACAVREALDHRAAR